MIVGVNVVALLLDVFEKLLESTVVFIGDEVRLCDDGGTVFKIDEAVGAFEVEVDFLWIEEVKHCDVMLAEAEVLEGITEFFGIDEEVGKNNDEGALLDFFGDLVKGWNEACFAFWFEVLQRLKNGLELRGASAGGDLKMDLFVTAAEASRIALVDDEVRKGGRDAAGEVDLGGMIG